MFAFLLCFFFLFKIFICGIIESQENLKTSAAGSEVSFNVLKQLRTSLNNVEIFNQNPSACLEELARNLMHINYMNDGILKKLA